MTKKIIIAVFMIIVLFIGGSLIKQISVTVGASSRLTELINEVQKLEIKNKQLLAEMERIKSKEFIEEQARNKLGLVKSGETMFIISDEKLKQILGVSQPAVQTKLPNWIGWLKLFWH